MPRAQQDRCLRCNKPLVNHVLCPCGRIVCSELCAKQHINTCVDCLGRISPPTKSSCGKAFFVTACVGVLGFFLAGVCIISAITSLRTTSASQVAQQTGTTGTPAPTQTTPATRPTTPTGPTATTPPTGTTRPTPQPPKALTVAEVTPSLDRQAVRVRGTVTEAEAATACTLDGTLSVTFASSPSPPVRKGQEITVEGTVFVVAGKVKLGRARVVD